MTIKEVKAFLGQLTKLDKMIENKLIEKSQWKAIATSVTAGSNNGERVQSSGNPQKMEDAVIKCIELENEIDQIVNELVDHKKEVIKVIEQLNPVYYDILHKIYVQHLTLYEVADICGNSYSWVTTVHGRALKDVQRLIGVSNEDSERR